MSVVYAEFKQADPVTADFRRAAMPQRVYRRGQSRYDVREVEAGRRYQVRVDGRSPIEVWVSSCDAAMTYMVKGTKR